MGETTGGAGIRKRKKHETNAPKTSTAINHKEWGAKIFCEVKSFSEEQLSWWGLNGVESLKLSWMLNIASCFCYIFHLKHSPMMFARLLQRTCMICENTCRITKICLRKMRGIARPTCDNRWSETRKKFQLSLTVLKLQTSDLHHRLSKFLNSTPMSSFGVRSS